MVIKNWIDQMLLSNIAPGSEGRIKKINDIHPSKPDSFPDLGTRLIEIGFEEDAKIVVLHESPLSKDPMAIKVNGRIIALRRIEAEAIEVDLTHEEDNS